MKEHFIGMLKPYLAPFFTEEEIQKLVTLGIKILMQVEERSSFSPQRVSGLISEIREIISDPVLRNTSEFSSTIRSILASVGEEDLGESFRTKKRAIAQMIQRSSFKMGFANTEAQHLAFMFYKEFAPFGLGKKNGIPDFSFSVKGISSLNITSWVEALRNGDKEGNLSSIVKEIIQISLEFLTATLSGVDERYIDSILSSIYTEFKQNSELFTKKQCLEIATKRVVSIFGLSKGNFSTPTEYCFVGVSLFKKNPNYSFFPFK